MPRELPRTDGPYAPSGPPWRPDTMIAVGRTEGTLGRRLWAYLIDIVMIALFSLLLCGAILVIGLLTFGLGWGLFALVPASAIFYKAITIGVRHQSTIGMRMAGLRVVDAVTGGRVGPLVAAAHALLFYVAVGTFLLWVADVGLGLVRSDHRFGHDLLTGIVVVRAA